MGRYEGIFIGTGIFLSILSGNLRRVHEEKAVNKAHEKELSLLNMSNFMIMDVDYRILTWSEGNSNLYGLGQQDVLLQISRLSQKPEPFKSIDLGKLAIEAAALFDDLLDKSGGIVKIDKLPVIKVEETQMLRLFQNLIGNAVKFCDERAPLINIFSRQDAGAYEIFINA